VTAGGERQFAHLTNHGGCVVRLPPLRFGEILAQLFRHRTVNVVITGRVATDPRMSKGLATREAFVRVDADQVPNELFGRVRNFVPIRRVEFEITFGIYSSLKKRQIKDLISLFSVSSDRSVPFKI
jgi:hypothetical protein